MTPPLTNHSPYQQWRRRPRSIAASASNGTGALARPLLIVQLGSVVERRPRARSVENAEVELEQEHREMRCWIAWRSERLTYSAARTAQIRPDGKRPSLAVRGDPNVRIAHVPDSMLADVDVVERDFRKRDEGKPGATSTQFPGSSEAGTCAKPALASARTGEAGASCWRRARLWRRAAQIRAFVSARVLPLDAAWLPLSDTGRALRPGASSRVLLRMSDDNAVRLLWGSRFRSSPGGLHFERVESDRKRGWRSGRPAHHGGRRPLMLVVEWARAYTERLVRREVWSAIS
jgi:hypothetical protein